MTETRLEELMELMMSEIHEDKMRHESEITNEMINCKLGVILELLHDRRDCLCDENDPVVTLVIGRKGLY